MVDLPVRWCWGATANNVKADSDIVRRFVRTRLDANCERPELRTGWKIPDLLGWARERRSELVSACLTIVRGWIDAGKPMGNYTLGSYEEWARVMGGILDFIGVNGFLGNLSSNDEVNSAEAEWRGFVNLWWAFLPRQGSHHPELIGIGGSLAAPPLPHHRAYGSVPRRFDRVKRLMGSPGEEGRSSRSMRWATPVALSHGEPCARTRTLSRQRRPRGSGTHPDGAGVAHPVPPVLPTVARYTCVIGDGFRR